MTGKKFKLKDLMNGDVVGYFDTVAEMEKAFNNYDRQCEGDWYPEEREFNPETGKYKLM